MPASPLQRGLARAIGADDAEPIAGADLEIALVQHRDKVRVRGIAPPHRANEPTAQRAVAKGQRWKRDQALRSTMWAAGLMARS